MPDGRLNPSSVSWVYSGVSSQLVMPEETSKQSLAFIMRCPNHLSRLVTMQRSGGSVSRLSRITELSLPQRVFELHSFCYYSKLVRINCEFYFIARLSLHKHMLYKASQSMLLTDDQSNSYHSTITHLNSSTCGSCSLFALIEQATFSASHSASKPVHWTSKVATVWRQKESVICKKQKWYQCHQMCVQHLHLHSIKNVFTKVLLFQPSLSLNLIIMPSDHSSSVASLKGTFLAKVGDFQFLRIQNHFNSKCLDSWPFTSAVCTKAYIKSYFFKWQRGWLRCI